MLDEGNLGVFTQNVRDINIYHAYLIINYLSRDQSIFMETDNDRRRENATSPWRDRSTTH